LEQPSGGVAGGGAKTNHLVTGPAKEPTAVTNNSTRRHGILLPALDLQAQIVLLRSRGSLNFPPYQTLNLCLFGRKALMKVALVCVLSFPVENTYVR
jgi:hypothetical protein